MTGWRGKIGIRSFEGLQLDVIGMESVASHDCIQNYGGPSHGFRRNFVFHFEMKAKTDEKMSHLSNSNALKETTRDLDHFHDHW